MDGNLSESPSMSLVFDLLSDMILNYLAKGKDRIAPPEVREAVLAIMEREAEEEMDHELTAELLGTPDYRIVA